ncbi:MAG: hypothetical protein MJ082_06405 [Clostridia bacterium]|nr:hypothetical protein [Clostridia bacterium]
MKRIAKLSDKELWATVVSVASENGIRLSSAQPSHEDLDKLRTILSNSENLGTWDAVRIIGEYRRKYGRG